VTTKRFTKKYAAEDYERLYDHAALLDLYLFDTQTKAQPDATEFYSTMKNGRLESDVRVELWRGKSAHGGYVVIMETLPNIWYLDDAIAKYRDNHSEHTLGIRICLERLTVKRNKLYEANLGRPLMASEQVSA
jgi:hypothetical protein